MLAKLIRELPRGERLAYEPKWDGFRCIVFRSGSELELSSRNARTLTRYFPELRAPLLESLPERAVVDGEIVIPGPAGLDFDSLLQRIHPAESRVALLARQTPASFVAFDLLALDDEDLRGRPFAERRERLEAALATARPPVHLTPITRDAGVAADWFERFEGAGLDGVMAKPLDLPYRPGKREMLKIKHERTADCVVGGFRWHKVGNGVGSLLLGLYDQAGVLHHVGIASGFSAKLRKELVAELEALRERALEGHPWAGWRLDDGAPNQRMPGGPSRWTAKRDLSWEPVRPERVVEVAYDHLQGSRFRHATTLRRFRLDRDPSSCRYSELDAVAPEELSRVFGAG
jgi:ATP-dependent DNA ligase